MNKYIVGLLFTYLSLFTIIKAEGSGTSGTETGPAENTQTENDAVKIDLKNPAYEDLTCLYVEKYHAMDCNLNNYTTGNCNLNFSYHSPDEETVFETDWIQQKIVSVAHTDKNCIDLSTGIFNTSNYTSQVVVTTTNDNSRFSYFVFNVVDEQTGISHEITSEADLVINGPLNYPKARFGKGFINYPTSDGLVYLSLDLVHLGADAKLPAGKCPSDLKIKGTVQMTNCLDPQLGFDTDKLFFSTFRFTYGLWTYAFQMVFFFIFTLTSKPDEAINQKYKDNSMTIHPIISVRNTGHRGFTKTSRYASIFITTSTWVFVNSLIIYLYHPADEEAYDPIMHTLTPVLISVVCSSIISHILGRILQGIATIHKRYANEYKGCQNMDQKEVLEDKYEAWKANWYFGYYSLCFILFQIFNWAAIWLQEDYHDNFKLYWTMNLAICFVLDFGILDTFAACVGRGDNAVAKCLQNRGFYYDYGLQDLFDQIDED